LYKFKKTKVNIFAFRKCCTGAADPQPFETNLMAMVDPGLTMPILKPKVEIAGTSAVVLGQALHTGG
jgi:hypothetical protein